MEWLRWWLAFHTGSLNSPGTPPNYNFYSGAGSIILPAMLDGLMFALLFWWHHQCHVRGCFWYARRKTAAGEPACFRHHPDAAPTHEQLIERHEDAKRGSDDTARH